MIHKDINLLNPEFRKIALQILEEFEKENIPYTIEETYRNQDVQDAYFAQGRKCLPEVNKLRKKAELYQITEKENKVITKTKLSNHTKGIAIDIVPIQIEMEKGKAAKIWNYQNSVWLKVQAIAKRMKKVVEWGGNWEPIKNGIGWDPPHWELKNA
jgi:sulfite reductase alpha subunit-like flavoprotein